ncbi:ABC transporter permease [Actinospica durhamensis]|uniref:ABC transporter permease n=1 Tax=Actinospica durhamensis TaxID=1508375 RepID=A0A941ENU8_9ACTN|nr:ABC transporter permease [Actinospica durhamensis]MBR7833857.1 ABC transporter permease [Actinospica durhamensis]
MADTLIRPLPAGSGPAAEAGSAQPAGAAPSARRRVRRLGPGRRIPFARALGPVLLIAAWSLASATGRLDPRILPAPWSVVNTGIQLWNSGTLGPDLAISLQRAGEGFAIGLVAGVALALVAGLSRIGAALIDGNVQINRALPILGMIPLFILWLGIGETFKITIIAMAVYIPIYINLSAALSAIDQRYVELAETLGLSRGEFLRHVVVPGALPGFFTGLRLGVTGSWLALVVVEEVNATSGLGYLMYQQATYGLIDSVVVGLAIYGIWGFASDLIVRLIERRVLSWRRTLAG